MLNDGLNIHTNFVYKILFTNQFNSADVNYMAKPAEASGEFSIVVEAIAAIGDFGSFLVAALWTRDASNIIKSAVRCSRKQIAKENYHKHDDYDDDDVNHDDKTFALGAAMAGGTLHVKMSHHLHAAKYFDISAHLRLHDLQFTSCDYDYVK